MNLKFIALPCSKKSPKYILILATLFWLMR